MIIRLAIDRLEGDSKSVAVLLPDSGSPINFPKALLPPGAKAGDILAFSIEVDSAATAKLSADTRTVQAELRKGDPGGDLKLWAGRSRS